VRRDVGLADHHRRQDLPGRRGRRHHDPPARPRTERHQRSEHGQLGLRHRRARQRHAVHHEPQSVVGARRGRAEEVARPMVGFWLLAAGVWLLAPGISATAQSPSWPQFRNTASLSGVSSERLDPPLKVLWTYQAGESVESSAAIVNDVAYVGAMDGKLHAIGLGDGKARWTYDAAPDISIGESSPAVANGIVYIGDLAGVLHAVDASSGKAVWTFKTDMEIKSSPVVTGNTVLIGSYDGHLYGLDAKTGKERWKLLTDSYVHATPTVVDGIAYF